MEKPLTEARIARLKWDADGSTVQLHVDPAHTGLAVRVYPTGSKSYVMIYSRHGDRSKRKLNSLGPVSEYTLAQAHAWWREQREKERAGIDLVAEKRVIKQEIRERATVAGLVEDYLADPFHEWSWNHARDSRRRGDVVKKAFGSLLPEQVTRANVLNLHKEITDRGSPIEANRTRTFVHSLFAWATDSNQAYLPEHHPNPAHQRRHRSSKKAKRNGGVGVNREHKRKRCFIPAEEEFSRLLASADNRPRARHAEWYAKRDGTILRLLFLTGLRRNELMKRQWSDVDWASRTLLVSGDPDTKGSTKNSRDLEMPLCPRAIELLEGLRDDVLSINRDAPIFTTYEGKALVERNAWETSWKKIREDADLRDWGAPDKGFRLHDIRTSVSTWLEEFAGYSDSQTGVLLNHAPQNQSITALHYSTDLGQKRVLMEKMTLQLEVFLTMVEEGREKEIEIAEVDHARARTA